MKKIIKTYLFFLLSIPKLGQPPFVIWWCTTGEGDLDDILSLFSDVARPLGAWTVPLPMTTCCCCCIPDGDEELTESLADVDVTKVVVDDDATMEDSEWAETEFPDAGCAVVVDVVTELELFIDNSSCRFFSYSVCFPCCISSLVKLAASSPKIQKKIREINADFLFQVHTGAHQMTDFSNVFTFNTNWLLVVCCSMIGQETYAHKKNCANVYLIHGGTCNHASDMACSSWNVSSIW